MKTRSARDYFDSVHHAIRHGHRKADAVLYFIFGAKLGVPDLQLPRSHRFDLCLCLCFSQLCHILVIATSSSNPARRGCSGSPSPARSRSHSSKSKLATLHKLNAGTELGRARFDGAIGERAKRKHKVAPTHAGRPAEAGEKKSFAKGGTPSRSFHCFLLQNSAIQGLYELSVATRSNDSIQPPRWGRLSKVQTVIQCLLSGIAPKAPEHLSTQNSRHSCRGTRRGEKPVPKLPRKGVVITPPHTTQSSREAVHPPFNPWRRGSFRLPVTYDNEPRP